MSLYQVYKSNNDIHSIFQVSKYLVQKVRSTHYQIAQCIEQFSLLPARASEYGTVIGLVSVWLSSKKNCN